MKDSAPSDDRPRFGAQARWALAALAFAVLLVVFVRVRLLQVPLERDEGEYAYAGQLLLEGIPPYQLAYNMKLPGAYVSYAAIMGVLGQTTAGIHFGFLLVNMATLALLFFVARRWLDVPRAALACVCYALLSMSSGVMGLEGHATHLVVLTALAGLWLLLQARHSGRCWSFLWSGIFFGVSFVCKQPGLVFAMCAGTLLMRDWVLGDPPSRKAQLRKMAIFCAGLSLPFLLTCAWLARAGTFDRFWFWTVVYARLHAHILSWQMGRGDLAAFNEQAGALRWWWLAAGAGLICLLADKDKARNEARFIIGGLLGFSLFGFAASFYFFPHYFIMVLPAISLLVAVLARRAAMVIGEAIPAVLLAMACAGFVYSQRGLWFEQTPEAVSRILCGENPFPEAAPIAKYIRDHSKVEDTIAIIGSEPEICFYAHRHSATGYIYMYDLMQSHAYAAAMQKEMMQQIEAAKPAFMLLVNVPLSWGMTTKSDLTIESWATSYARQHYGVAGKVWMLRDHTEYLWGREASTRTFEDATSITILQRMPGT